MALLEWRGGCRVIFFHTPLSSDESGQSATLGPLLVPILTEHWKVFVSSNRGSDARALQNILLPSFHSVTDRQIPNVGRFDDIFLSPTFKMKLIGSL